MMGFLKNLLFALALAVIVGVGYLVFTGNDDEDGIVSVTSTGSGSAAALQTQEFLDKLKSLNAVELDGSVFDDPRFNSLRDYRQILEDEPTGRQNPFAPIDE